MLAVSVLFAGRGGAERGLKVGVTSLRGTTEGKLENRGDGRGRQSATP